MLPVYRLINRKGGTKYFCKILCVQVLQKRVWFCFVKSISTKIMIANCLLDIYDIKGIASLLWLCTYMHFYIYMPTHLYSNPTYAYTNRENRAKDAHQHEGAKVSRGCIPHSLISHFLLLFPNSKTNSGALTVFSISNTNRYSSEVGGNLTHLWE